MKALHSKQVLICILLFTSTATSAQLSATASQVTVPGNKVMADGKVIVFSSLDASEPDKLAKQGRCIWLLTVKQR